VSAMVTRLRHSNVRSTLSTLALAAFVLAPAFKVAIGTAGSNWN
jgi:hypothetical protein